MSIGEKIKELRSERNLSQAQLGGLIGVSQKAVAFWESDTNEPRVGYVLALIRALDITYEDFFEDID